MFVEPPPGSEQAMNSSPNSDSARQLARKQGLARMSAVTLGVGTAGVLGAVAIALNLPAPVATSTAGAATSAAAGSTSDQSSSIDSTNLDSDESTTSQAQAEQLRAQQLRAEKLRAQQLQAARAPSTTNNPPAATSAAS
jgi:hypothetical protein